MDGWIDLLYHLQFYIYIYIYMCVCVCVCVCVLEDPNVCNVHSPANIYTVHNFFPCSLSISTVTTATLVFSLTDDLNLLLSICTL
jgi:hypothetical protein